MTDRYAIQLDALRRGTLEPAGFSHLDHVGVAVEALRRHSYFEALAVIADGLKDVATRAGKPEKFHATLTLASMCLIAERLAANPTVDIAAFVEGSRAWLTPAALEALYPDGALATPLARTVGLLPRVTG
ncbi:MAG: hypothetical protein EAZ99_10890 [Alphaproteobacteria bacterium]|nr:MAG: hypothetical protein EAZ99_10890 [Alphaproteobacteria bacterium]